MERPIVEDFEDLPEEFVIKSNKGLRGGGRTVVILKNTGGGHTEPDGKKYSLRQIITRFLRDDPPYIIEEKVVAHRKLAEISAYGEMPDFRIVFVRGEWFLTVLRIPTLKSRGYGNLRRGAVPMSVDKKGRVFKCGYAREPVTVHPDTGEDLEGFKIPLWDRNFKKICELPNAFGSPVVCADGTIDTKGEFVVLEVTVNPHLVWVNRKCRREILKRIRRKLIAGELHLFH